MPRLRFVTATELRDRLREHIRRLGSDPIVIARHGRAVLFCARDHFRLESRFTLYGRAARSAGEKPINRVGAPRMME